MSGQERVVRDERTEAVENASCKWAYAFVMLALLIDVVYRVTVTKEHVRDLICLIIVGAGTRLVYRCRQMTVSWPSQQTIRFRLAAAIVAAVVAAVMVIIVKTKVM